MNLSPFLFQAIKITARQIISEILSEQVTSDLPPCKPFPFSILYHVGSFSLKAIIAFSSLVFCVVKRLVQHFEVLLVRLRNLYKGSLLFFHEFLQDLQRVFDIVEEVHAVYMATLLWRTFFSIWFTTPITFDVAVSIFLIQFVQYRQLRSRRNDS